MRNNKWSWRRIWLGEIEPPSIRGVYFIQNANGYIKIGHSTNIRNRIVQYQTHSPMLIWLVGYIETYEDIDTEYFLKEYFSDYNIGGEWFAPVKTVLNYLRNFDKGKGISLDQIDDPAELLKEQEKYYLSTTIDYFPGLINSDKSKMP